MSRAKKWILRNAQKIFLDSHECREQKNGVKKTRENFFDDSHEYREQQHGGKKPREIFFIHNNVESKKMDFRNAPKIILDSHEFR